MCKDNVFDLKKPEPFIDDQITAIIRQGYRDMHFTFFDFFSPTAIYAI